MGIAGSIVVFVCASWMVFFMALPWGVRGQWEDDDVAEGTEPGAPVSHGLGKKALIAVAGGFVVWAIAWTVVTFELHPFERPVLEFGTGAAAESDE